MIIPFAQHIARIPVQGLMFSRRLVGDSAKTAPPSRSRRALVPTALSTSPQRRSRTSQNNFERQPWFWATGPDATLDEDVSPGKMYAFERARNHLFCDPLPQDKLCLVLRIFGSLVSKIFLPIHPDCPTPANLRRSRGRSLAPVPKISS